MRLACRLGQCFKMLRILSSPPETRTPLDTRIFSSKMVPKLKKRSLTLFFRKYKTAVISILAGMKTTAVFILNE